MRHTSGKLTTRVNVDAAETVFGLVSAVGRITVTLPAGESVVTMTGTDPTPTGPASITGILVGSVLGSAIAPPRGTLRHSSASCGGRGEAPRK